VRAELMTFVAGLLGKRDVADRLFGSLQVDSSKARDMLGWEPVVSMDEALKRTDTDILSNRLAWIKIVIALRKEPVLVRDRNDG